MSINIWTDSMQHAALLGKPVLFTNWLIQRDIIPDGWYCYDLRGTHKSPSTRTTLVDHAADYHAGTVLSPIPLKHEGTASRRVNGTFYLLGEEMTLEQFCEEHDLAYPQDNREFVLRPASLDEVGLFYSEEKLDEALGIKSAPMTLLSYSALERLLSRVSLISCWSLCMTGWDAISTKPHSSQSGLPRRASMFGASMRERS